MENKSKNNKKRFFNIKINYFLIVVFALALGFSFANPNNSKKNISSNRNTYKMYLQTEAGKDIYSLSNSNLFPKAGYTLNTTKSTCTNGGTVEQKENYSISFSGEAQNCTLYFDIVDVNSYTLSFNAHGGSTPASISKQEGDELGTLPTSTRTGYDFDGWYTAATGGRKVTATDTMPRADFEVHAHWTIKQFTITYDAASSGGETNATPKTVNYDSLVDLTPTATREGYEFVGWNTNINAKAALESLHTPAADTTLYAMFKKTITVTFEPNGNTLSENSKSCDIWNNDANCSITSPTITGHANTPNVIGYSTSENNHESSWGSNSSKNVSANATYYAQTKSNQSTYTINYTKGKGVASLSKESDSCKTTLTYNGVQAGNSCQVTLPTITLNAGYENPAWSDGSSVASGTQKTLTQNASITASSSPIEYLITYILNGGEAENPETYTVETNTFTLNNPTKGGNTFNGWTGSNGSTPEKTVTITKGTTGNKTYTANYSVNSFKITYDRRTNGGNEANEEVTYNYGENVNLNKTATKDGFEFVGWGLDEDDQSKLESLPMPEEDTTLYAIFKKTVRIDFEANGNTVSKLYGACTIWNKDTSCLVTSAKITAPANTPNIIGFSTAPNTHTNAWSANTSRNVSENATYYAQTKSSTDTYDVTYIKGTGVSAIGKESDSCTTPLSYNGAERTLTCSVILPSITLNDGYGDPKWNNTYSAGSTFTLDDDETFTATGVPGSYSITYELHGGNATNPTSYTVETEGFTLNNPTKTGYTFTGWTGTNLSSATTNVTIPTGSTGNREYEAHYSANTYTITFDADGGSVSPTSKEVTYDDTYGELPTPTKAGYNFSHWELNGTTIESTTTVKITGNSTLVAKYEPKCIKVTLTSTGYSNGASYTAGTTTFYYKFNTAEEENDQPVYIYSNNTCTTKLNDGQHITKARALYNTSGWTTYQGSTNNGYYTSSNGGGTQYIDYDELVSYSLITNVTSDITLYAYWTNTESYRIAYNLRGGTAGSNAPTSANYTTQIQIDNPTKTFKFQPNENGSGATMGAATTGTPTFDGWTFDGDTSVAQNGTMGLLFQVSWTNWSSQTTKTKNTYFRRLIRDATVTMTANWTSISVRTPTLTKDGSTCKWNTKPDGSGNTYNPNTNYTVSNATQVGTLNIYAICSANNYNVSYNYNHGTPGSDNPSNVMFDTVTRISNPSKTVNITVHENSSGADIGNNMSINTPFEGWTASGLTTTSAVYGTSEDNVETSWSNGNTKVTAEYFKNLAASGTVTLTANYEAKQITLPKAEKYGYVCSWNTESDGSGTDYGSKETITIDSTFDSDIDLYASCGKAKYIIEYDYNGGKSGGSAPEEGEYNEVIHVSNPVGIIITGDANNTDATIGAPSQMTGFRGWTATGVDSSTAKYGTSSSDVNTSWNGTSIANANYFKNLSLTDGQVVTLKAEWQQSKLYVPTISKKGYSCKWNTKSDGSGTIYESGAEYTGSTETDVTLYARCTAIKYNVVYDYQGGTISSASGTNWAYDNGWRLYNPTKTVTVTANANGAGATISNNNRSAAQTFRGWELINGDYTTAHHGTSSGSGINTAWTNQNQYTTDTWFKNLQSVNGATVTMKAHWTGVGVQLPTATKTGFECTFNTESDGSGDSYPSGGTYVPAEDDETTVTLYTICTSGNYNISYTCNGGTCNGPTTAAYGTVINIPNPTKTVTVTGISNGTNATIGDPTSSAQTFNGWNATSGLDTTNAYYGTSASSVTTRWRYTSTYPTAEYYKNLNATANSTVTLTARWTARAVTLPTISKQGYSCNWNTNSSGTGTSYASGASYTPSATSAANINMYAICTPLSYNISYSLNGGTNGTNAPTSATYDTPVEISNPSKTVTITGNANGTGATIGSSTSGAQTFDGWTFNGNTNTAKYGTSSDSVNTAWSNSSTKVKATFFKNLTATSGGTATMTANWTPVAINLPTISKEGFACKWNTNSSGTGTNYNSGASYTPSATSAASVTVYAVCTDSQKPTVSVSSSQTQKSASQTVTLTMTDNVGVTGYYLGTTSPTSDSTFTSISSGTSKTQNVTVNAKGTYYAASKDAAGNISDVKTITFYQYTVHNMLQNVSGSTYTTTHYTEDSSYTYIAPKGASLSPASIGTVPEHSNSGRFVGLSTGTASTTAATPTTSAQTLNADAVYTTWYTRNMMYIKYTLGDGDVLTPSTTNSAGTSTYTWTVNSSGNISLSTNGGTTTDNFYSYRAGISSIDLADYNNTHYLNISKLGYTAVSGAQWICTSGCATSNKTFTHSSLTISNSDTEICNAKTNDCTIKIKVNWAGNPYNIAYSYNGGSAGNNAPTTANFGTPVNITKPTKTFRITGDANGCDATIGSATTKAQTFDGWTAANLNTSTAMYGNSATSATTAWTNGSTKANATYFNSLTPTTNATVTLTANWTAVSTTMPTISKTGYTTRWYLNSGGTGTAYDSGAAYMPTANADPNLTVYAKCTPNTYNITYNYNNGTKGSSAPASATYDNVINISKPTKTVKVNVSANSTGATLSATSASQAQTFGGWTPSNINTSTAYYGTSNTAVTTRWSSTSTKPTAEYYKNLRADNSATVNLTANWSGNVSLPTVTKTGYTCNFNTASDGSGTSYSSGGTYTVSNITATTVQLYARCSVNSYTLTVNAGEGSYSGTTPLRQEYGSTTTVPNPTPKSYTVTYKYQMNSISDGSATSSKTFKSWSAPTYGRLSGTTFTFGAGNDTLTASYNDNPNVTLPTKSTTIGSNSISISVKNWTTGSSGSGTSYTSGSSFKPTSNTTLYAQWYSDRYLLNEYYKSVGSPVKDSLASNLHDGCDLLYAGKCDSDSCDYTNKNLTSTTGTKSANELYQTAGFSNYCKVNSSVSVYSTYGTTAGTTTAGSLLVTTSNAYYTTETYVAGSTTIWRKVLVPGSYGSNKITYNGSTYSVGYIVETPSMNNYADSNSYTSRHVLRRMMILNPNISYGGTSGSVNFNSTSSSDDGVISIQDYNASNSADGYAYVFRGKSENNYVRFGGFYWRILRVNGNGSIKLIYHGTSASSSGTAQAISTKAEFNHSDNASSLYARAVGYMFNSSETSTTVSNDVNSTIKSTVDSWYSSNLNSYTSYIDKSRIFCNDRSCGSGTCTGKSSGSFSAKVRLTNGNPTLSCANSVDRFGTSGYGNGKLTYPVGLITADEAVLAGYKWNGSSLTLTSNNYLGKSFNLLGTNECYWTMTPGDNYQSSALYGATVGNICDTGYLGPAVTSVSNFVVPVVNVSSTYAIKMTGGGTSSNPFVIS